MRRIRPHGEGGLPGRARAPKENISHIPKWVTNRFRVIIFTIKL
jgi:hypothetical protein